MYLVLVTVEIDSCLQFCLCMNIFVLFCFYIFVLDYRAPAVQILTQMMTSMQVISRQQLLDRSALWVTRQLTRLVLCDRTL